jgi:hypothetical protein
LSRAQITITRKSNGEKVVCYLEAVNRNKRLVVLEIPQDPYNSRFTFSDVDGEIENEISIVSGSRQAIDESKLVTDHVSTTVYAGMAGWAGSILNSRRR